jgi:flavorubredoxin
MASSSDQEFCPYLVKLFLSINPGDSINVGDRKLTAVRPPLFDNPTTIGIYDDSSQAFFSADSFGGILSSPAQDADEIREVDLSQGMTVWACSDSPWVHMVQPSKFNKGWIEFVKWIRR